MPDIEVGIDGLEVLPVSSHKGSGADGVVRATLADVEVDDAGLYTVRTKPRRNYYVEEKDFEPKILFDPAGWGFEA